MCKNRTGLSLPKILCLELLLHKNKPQTSLSLSFAFIFATSSLSLAAHHSTQNSLYSLHNTVCPRKYNPKHPVLKALLPFPSCRQAKYHRNKSPQACLLREKINACRCYLLVLTLQGFNQRNRTRRHRCNCLNCNPHFFLFFK